MIMVEEEKLENHDHRLKDRLQKVQDREALKITILQERAKLQRAAEDLQNIRAQGQCRSKIVVAERDRSVEAIRCLRITRQPQG